jgi:hypothetical protein
MGLHGLLQGELYPLLPEEMKFTRGIGPKESKKQYLLITAAVLAVLQV